jgi:glyoxylase-like metal-dependent hydrolase (beta-lactamase superfamily II)
MPRIPLEDTFSDIIAKTQRGLALPDEELCQKAGVAPAELAAAKAGRINVAVIRRLARQLQLDPDALEVSAARTWYPDQPNFPTGFAMFNTPFEDMTVNSYLIWDGRTKIAAAFDTGANCADMLNTISAEGLQVRYIFITHCHDDHIADLDRLAAETQGEIWSSDQEPIQKLGAKTFGENVHFHVGPLSIKTLLTSGHSPGLTTFFVTGLSWPLAVVGDSIFAGSMGGSAEAFLTQWQNDRKKILSLPRDTVLACGHGPLTTVGQEKRHNPFFTRPSN